MNDGTEPLVCLVIGQRLAQDVVDYPRTGKRLYRNSGQRDMVDSRSEYSLQALKLFLFRCSRH